MARVSSPGPHASNHLWYLVPERSPIALSAAQLEASATRLSTPERYRATRPTPPTQDSRASTATGSTRSCAQSGMRELGPDGCLYTRVGTQWVKQLYLPQADVDAIVQRLSTQTLKAESANWQSKAVAVKLTYVHDSAKGHKETYVPVKKVSKEDNKQGLCALADRCQEGRKATKAELQNKYLQPIAKVKVYTKEEEQNHMARVQRLVEGLGAFG